MNVNIHMYCNIVLGQRSTQNCILMVTGKLHNCLKQPQNYSDVGVLLKECNCYCWICWWQLPYVYVGLWYPLYLKGCKICVQTTWMSNLSISLKCAWPPRPCVTPQDVIPTQDVIIAARCNTIYARCNKYAKCNNFYARCNKTYQREM